MARFRVLDFIFIMLYLGNATKAVCQILTDHWPIFYMVYKNKLQH